MSFLKKKVTNKPEEQTLDEIVHDENNFEGEETMNKKGKVLKGIGIGAAVVTGVAAIAGIGYKVFKGHSDEDDVTLDEFEDLFDENVEPEENSQEDETSDAE